LARRPRDDPLDLRVHAHARDSAGEIDGLHERLATGEQLVDRWPRKPDEAADGWAVDGALGARLRQLDAVRSVSADIVECRGGRARHSPPGMHVDELGHAGRTGDWAR